MRQKILQYKEILQFLLIIGAVYLAMKLFLIPFINTPEFLQFINDIGLWGYLIILIYIVVSQVFAPISGTPGIALAISIYGIDVGMWILYYAGLISCTINFYISRHYGKGILKKFVGEEGMKEVDEFTAVGGSQVLFVSRILGFSLFDFISYAAGLTKIPFKNYFFITAISSLITNVIIQYIFKDVDFHSEEGITLWIVTIAVAAIISGIIIKIYISNIRKRLKNETSESV
jgi:uncharacterized membrane protein YdjX (TVP38/TMEM64 family)